MRSSVWCWIKAAVADALRRAPKRECHWDFINTRSAQTPGYFMLRGAGRNSAAERGTEREDSSCVWTQRPCRIIFTLITWNSIWNFPFGWKTEACPEPCMTLSFLISLFKQDLFLNNSTKAAIVGSKHFLHKSFPENWLHACWNLIGSQWLFF